MKIVLYLYAWKAPSVSTFNYCLITCPVFEYDGKILPEPGSFHLTMMVVSATLKLPCWLHYQYHLTWCVVRTVAPYSGSLLHSVQTVSARHSGPGEPVDCNSLYTSWVLSRPSSPHTNNQQLQFLLGSPTPSLHFFFCLSVRNWL